jgi:hypothetical protein
MIQMSKDSSKRFLNRIFGVVAMAKHLIANRKYQRVKRLDQLDHGGILSS